MDKRNFIKTLGALSVSSLVSASELTKIKSVSHSLPKTRSDEELWATIRSHYTLKDDYINLESGYYSIIPNPVLEHFIKHVRHVNIEGSYYMRNDLKKNKDRVIRHELRQFRYIKFLDQREKKKCKHKEQPYPKHYK